MGSAALRPAVSVGRLLREQRKARRLTLREVSDHMADLGERIPTSTLARIEQGKLDPGVRRLYLLLDFFDVSGDRVAHLCELERSDATPPTSKNLERIHRDGLRAWRKGDIPRGLAHLEALREIDAGDPEKRRLRAEAMLDFASAAREQGRSRLALQLVDELLCDPQLETALLPDTLLLAARLWRDRGSHATAAALAREAAEHVDPSDGEEKARVTADLREILKGISGPAESVLAGTGTARTAGARRRR